MALWRAWPVLLLAAVPAASGHLAIDETAAVGLSAITPPGTLAATAHGSTTLGASLTSGSTTFGSLSTLIARDVLHIDAADAAWTVRLQLESAGGFGALDSVTISLANGLVTEVQIDILLGIVTQTTGPAIEMDLVDAPDLDIRAIGTKASFGSSVLDMQVVLVPDAGRPELRYDYVLTLT